MGSIATETSSLMQANALTWALGACAMLLVVLKGDKELGRIVAGTGKDEIKALMDVALAAV